MDLKKSRKKIGVGDLVQQINFRHEQYNKLGVITSVMEASAPALRVYYVLCEGQQCAWFAGDFRRVQNLEKSSVR